MHRLLLAALVLALGACSTFEAPSRRFVVFYSEWSAALDDPGKAVVSGAAEFAKRHPEQPIIVSGFADPEGTAQANVDISRTRAQAVADQLVADGVAPARIQRRARGSVNFESSSQESRRVEIAVGAN